MLLIPEPTLTKEPTLPQAQIKCGYYGLNAYSDIGVNRETRSSIYCISDPLSAEMDLIPLTIGAFPSLYHILSQHLVSGATARIFPLSIQFDYISDIINTVSTFNRMYDMRENVVRWGFPVRPKEYSTEEFETRQDKGSAFSNHFDSSIGIFYYKSSIANLYDIVIQTSEAKRYFTQYMTKEKLEMLLGDTSIDEIHMCAAVARHGGLTGIDLKDFPFKEGKDKIRFFNYTSAVRYSPEIMKWKGGNLYDEL